MEFGFLWYIAIGVGILLTLFAWRTKRAITKMSSDQVSEIGRVLGTEFGVALMGCVAFGIVLAFVYQTKPGGKKLKEDLYQHQLATHRALGEILGADLVAKAKPQSTGLIIMRDVDGQAKEYMEAICEGLKQACGNKIDFKRREVIKVPKDIADPELEQAKALFLGSSELDAIAGRNSDCNVVICLMDISPEYPATSLAADVLNGNKLFGLVSYDPYMLGGPIYESQITACVVPRRVVGGELLPPTATAQERFDRSYWLVTHKNLLEVIKTNRRLFYMVKRIGD